VNRLHPELDLTGLEIEHDYCAMASLPLYRDHRLLGALSIYSSSLEQYTDDHMRLLETVTTLASDALANAMHHAEAKSNALTDPLTGLPNARYLATLGRVRPKHRKTFEAAILGQEQGHAMIRAHVVEEKDNPLYHRLLREAGKATGLPVLYNTSFNLFGDPLVSAPRDAVRSFYSSGIDAMFVGNFLLEK
jgi:GAF domain-containing protein